MNSLYDKLIIPPDKRYISISEKEGLFLDNFIKKNNIKFSLETGFAYGCSTAFIISATKAWHYAIDPFQETYYNNIGLHNIRTLGLFDYLRFEHDSSQMVLPRLSKIGIKINLALIDGGHKFDNIFIDFFYIDLMLNIGGFVIFHDSWLRSTQYVASWIKTNKKNYALLKVHIKNFIIFRKLEEDDRDYYYFKGFCTYKSIYSHYRKVNELKKRC